MDSKYHITPELNNKLTIRWLENGVISLALAGLYSIILVILRTPQLKSFITNPEIFRSALVVHVNLSVLVWLMSITAIIWSYNLRFQFFGIICSWLALFGSIMIGVSPLFGQNFPVMDNYIPMLENIVFIIGLSLFGTAMLLFAISVIYGYIFTSIGNGSLIISFAAASSATIFILVWLCFVSSYFQLQEIIKLVPIDIEFYYELLYWSGGHILQFLYTQILIVVWLLLFQTWIAKNLRFQKFYLFALYLNFLLSLGGLAGHFLYNIVDSGFKEFYTTHMKYAGGLAPTFSLLLMMLDVFRDKKLAKSFVKCSIVCSSLLFLSGGLIGIRIAGINVTIPAHYHGSIVGISIAFMGLAYIICSPRPSLSQTVPTLNNIQSWQIYIITLGQILHIGGLAFAGGYGILRKTVAAELAISAKIAMGLMGVGGLVAIIGGLMFVFICGKRLCSLSLKGY